MLQLRIGSIVGAIVFSLSVFAQTTPLPPKESPAVNKTSIVQPPPGRPQFKSERQAIVYGSSAWNRSPKEIDSAFLFIRDGKSGRMAKIIVDETEPDSSIFSGEFSINWAADAQAEPEIYIPPMNIRNDEKGLKDFSVLLQNKKIGRKPFFLRKEKNKQVIEVYDTKAQATAALDALRSKDDAEKAKRALTKPVLNPQQAEFTAAAERQTLIAKLASEAAQREADRVRMEQIERQKQLDLMANQRKLKEDEIRKRAAMAQQIANEAKALYEKGDYVNSEIKFKESFELDPSNKENYYFYGISLYRNEKYNDALVALKLSTVPQAQELEKKYFLALTHYRLKELDSSQQLFREVRNMNHPVLSPSSAFYEGTLQFGREEYNEAKESFEYVLDNSSDPKMDTKAEQMIENCIKALAYQKDAKRKHLVTFTAGLIYDSNVLLQSDADTTASVTDIASPRLQASGSYDYRFIYKEKTEFQAGLTALTQYTTNDDLSYADATVIGATLPYSWKGLWETKSYKFSLIPGYEMTNLDADRDGSAESILSSIYLTPTLTLFGSKNYLAIYSFEVRQDDSTLDITTDADDADSLKLTLDTTQMFFQDEAKKKAFIITGALTNNAAVGDNKSYNKIEAGLYYTAPFTKWTATWNGGLLVYFQDYGSASPSRTDQDYSLSYTVTKSITEEWSWNGNLTYINNPSTVDSFQYSKYTATVSATYSGGF